MLEDLGDQNFRVFFEKKGEREMRLSDLRGLVLLEGEDARSPRLDKLVKDLDLNRNRPSEQNGVRSHYSMIAVSLCAG